MIDTSKQVSADRPAQGLNIAFTILSVLGALDAGTLWWAHRQNIDLPCIENSHACEDDWNSRWGHVDLVFWHYVPVALLGLFGYIALLTIGFARLGAETPAAWRWLTCVATAIASFGCAFSLFLQYQALIVMHAPCPWCIASACIMTALCVISLVEFRRLRRLSVIGTAPSGS